MFSLQIRRFLITSGPSSPTQAARHRRRRNNIFRVSDVTTRSKLLAYMGATVPIAEIPARNATIPAPPLNHAEAHDDLVKATRASMLTLAPLMADLGVARVSLPGGCAIGAGPI